MTKKFFFTLLVGCFYLTNAINAQTEVNLVLDRGSIVRHGHPQAVPTATTNGDEIDIKCDSVISNVDVVIKDQYGTVMHQSTLTIGPDETTINVPSIDGDSEKTTIDLYYDRKHLSGYFE